MEKILPWIIGAIMVAVVLVCGALFLTDSGKDKKSAVQPPVAERAVETSGPAIQPTPPTPPKPLPTPPQVNDCAETSRKANGLSASEARRLQIGQKVILVVNGQRREVSVVAGDHFWKMCRAALTDPVSARYHAAQKEVTALNERLTETNREVAAAQAVLTTKTQVRDRLALQKDAAQRRVAAAQDELNERARQARVAAGARPRQPASGTPRTTS